MTLTFPSQLSLSTIPKFPFPNPKFPSYSTLIPKSTPSRATLIKPQTDCVRTYENDLVRLTLTCLSGLDQSLSAASADGGRVANEHIDAGVDQMGIVTFSPGPADDRSTISTKLAMATSLSQLVLRCFFPVLLDSSRANYTREYTKPSISGWTSAMQSKLEKIGGVEFSKWTSEHVPAYRLEINANRLANISFEGWKRTSENKLEVLLTHSQMVALADVLDMYLEDVYTLPSKQLSRDLIRSPNKLLHDKSRFSLLGFARTTLVAGILLVSVGAMANLFLPHLYTSRRTNEREYPILSVSESEYEEVKPAMLVASQLEAYCCALVRKLKDFYGWNGDVKFDPNFGAWIGEIPTTLRNDHVADPISQDVSASSGTSNDRSSIQEIASYQAVLSSHSRVVGFQPTSGVAVNHWAANPIAKELYGGKELSPGLVEPGLKIKKPENVIVMELLMSLSQDNYFALARLVQ